MYEPIADSRVERIAPRAVDLKVGEKLERVLELLATLRTPATLDSPVHIEPAPRSGTTIGDPGSGGAGGSPGRSKTTDSDNPVTTALAALVPTDAIDKLPDSGPSICPPSRASGTALVSALGEELLK